MAEARDSNRVARRHCLGSTGGDQQHIGGVTDSHVGCSTSGVYWDVSLLRDGYSSASASSANGEVATS